MAIKRSAIFPLTTLDGFDFNFPKSIDEDLVLRAAGLDFIKERANVVFVGPSGVGKTHLANAIAQMACCAAPESASPPPPTWSMTWSQPRRATRFTAAWPYGPCPSS